MQFLWKYLEDLVGKGLDYLVIIELFVYASASLVSMSLPLSVLLSSIMTYGTLGENNELIAIKSAGISLKRAMRPVFLFVMILSVSSLYFTNNIQTRANLKFRTLLYDISKAKPVLEIKEGVFFKGIDGVAIRVKEKNTETGLLKDVMIYDHRGGSGNKKVTLADSAKMITTADQSALVFELYSGVSYEEKDGKSAPHQKIEFETHTTQFKLEGFDFQESDEESFKNHYKMLNIRQLNHGIDSLYTKRTNRETDFVNGLEGRFTIFSDSTFEANVMQNRRVDVLDDLYKYQKTSAYRTALNIARSTSSYAEAMENDQASRLRHIYRYKIEWHRKFVLSIACILMFFIGAPLGSIIRKGGLGLPVLVSIIFFLIYHIISLTSEKMVKEATIQPILGMWISSMVMLPIGVFFTIKATTETIFFSSKSYQRLTDGLLKILGPIAKYAKRFWKWFIEN